jgi:hypothetical protein
MTDTAAATRNYTVLRRGLMLLSFKGGVQV